MSAKYDLDILSGRRHRLWTYGARFDSYFTIIEIKIALPLVTRCLLSPLLSYLLGVYHCECKYQNPTVVRGVCGSHPYLHISRLTTLLLPG